MEENPLREKSEKISRRDLEDLVKREKDIFSLISKIEKSTFKTLKEDVETLFELLKDYYKGEYTAIPWRSVALAVFAFLYLINPIDLIPDLSGPLGFIDDLAIIGSVLASLADDVRRYKKWKQSKEGKNEGT
ncbi:MAG: YkvA family protein [Candidatus Hydrothermia bacterium]